MRSLKELYKIGKGPSSSHTIGPEMVCQYVIRKHGKQKYRVDLFGSLALTGKGHGTDRVIKSVLGDDTVINFVPEFSKERHPNTMEVYRLAGDTCEKLLTAESVGGGSVRIDGKLYPETKEVYPQKSFDEVVKFCREYNLRLSEYASFYENGIEDYALEVWKVMKESVIRGLTTEGVISGGLNLYRKAKALYGAEAKYETAIMRENRKISAYALAVAEENADNGVVVTAPTCGSAGIVPACLYYMYNDCNTSEKDVINAVLTAGVIGNVVKTNASISGAECGCQAEVGVACSMAAAAIADIYELDIEKIGCSAEIALEHNLGLTCDPVLGLVQIPCIERNASAATDAFNATVLARSLADKRKISFDDIVAVMYETGNDMATNYRETAQGGLAKIYKVTK